MYKLLAKNITDLQRLVCLFHLLSGLFYNISNGSNNTISDSSK